MRARSSIFLKTSCPHKYLTHSVLTASALSSCSAWRRTCGADMKAMPRMVCSIECVTMIESSDSSVRSARPSSARSAACCTSWSGEVSPERKSCRNSSLSSSAGWCCLLASLHSSKKDAGECGGASPCRPSMRCSSSLATRRRRAMSARSSSTRGVALASSRSGGRCAAAPGWTLAPTSEPQLSTELIRSRKAGGSGVSGAVAARARPSASERYCCSCRVSAASVGVASRSSGIEEERGGGGGVSCRGGVRGGVALADGAVGLGMSSGRSSVVCSSFDSHSSSTVRCTASSEGPCTTLVVDVVSDPLVCD
mmetsp:Transcript_18842/g.45177  ORF Transcript_18842/g.45177 Transcript_18842/m.45177 type:complete len:310 (+) Transcript_18842:838-1767(+)